MVNWVMGLPGILGRPGPFFPCDLHSGIFFLTALLRNILKIIKFMSKIQWYLMSFCRATITIIQI